VSITIGQVSTKMGQLDQNWDKVILNWSVSDWRIEKSETVSHKLGWALKMADSVCQIELLWEKLWEKMKEKVNKLNWFTKWNIMVSQKRVIELLLRGLYYG